jgi:hypothetical protein
LLELRTCSQFVHDQLLSSAFIIIPIEGSNKVFLDQYKYASNHEWKMVRIE